MLPSSVPDIYSKFAAISTIATCLERRVYIYTKKGRTHANQFFMLVGKPATGKSLAIGLVRSLLDGTGVIHLASDSVTKASLIDELTEAVRDTTNLPDCPPFHHLALVLDEFGLFIDKKEPTLFHALSKFWDSSGDYKESRRTGNVKHHIVNPCMNICGGIQPAMIGVLFEARDFQQGYCSRNVWIYSDAEHTGDLFDIDEIGQSESELQHLAKVAAFQRELKCILHMTGEMRWGKGSRELVNYHANIPHSQFIADNPHMAHPNLAANVTRRNHTAIKFAMAISANYGCDMVISEQHVHEAYELMTLAEKGYPLVMENMQVSETQQLIEETYLYCMRLYRQTNKPVRKRLLIAFISKRINADKIMYIWNALVHSGMLLQTEGAYGAPVKTGHESYKPNPNYNKG